jgi:23S rRNA (pseudouridine1915-N3)-methyltransferase
MRLVIAAVGRLKIGPDRALAERYRERAAKAGRTLGIRGIETVEVKESRAHDTKRRIVEEAVALSSVVPDGAIIVVLDRNGEDLTSDCLAAQFRAWRDDASQTVCFVVGGADGLGESLRQRATLKLAFGAATWPHQLVRIMLMEQIYRAITILSGHPYHRD